MKSPALSGVTRTSIEAKAADWLTRRESRALTPDEQLDFDRWRAADQRHEAAVRELEAAWASFDRLSAYPRPAGQADDPDFFARPNSFRRPVAFTVMVAVAAASVAACIALFEWRPASAPSLSPPAAVVQVSSQFQLLPDGSSVELKTNSRVTEAFTPSERRVRLERGEAHFTVAKNPSRPFVVEANGVAIRAVGTAFNVRLDAATVEVLVTEGKVAVNAQSPQAAGAANPPPQPTSSSLLLSEGQRVVVSTDRAAAPAKAPVQTLRLADVDRLLAWQISRLVFDATPLAEVVARFNQTSASQPSRSPGAVPHLILDDPRLGATLISGRLRSDDVTSFVELLESSFGVIADRRANGDIFLRANKR